MKLSSLSDLEVKPPLISSFAWLVCAVVIFLMLPTIFLSISVICAVISCIRLNRARKILSSLGRLFSYEAATMPVKTLVSMTAFRDRGLWLGKGFAWQERHARLARDLAGALPVLKAGFEKTSRLLNIFPVLPRLLKDTAATPHTAATDAVPGAPWIHRLEDDQGPVYLSSEELRGHTLIAGTTGAGKTRLYEIIATQLIHAGKTLVIIDPKGDTDLEKRLRDECERAKRTFLYFNPAHPERSIRLQPLMNYRSVSDAASRISELLDAPDSFTSFAWKALFDIMLAMEYDGARPNLLDAKRYVTNGVEPLLKRVLSRALSVSFGANWKTSLPPARAPSFSSYKAPQIKDPEIEPMITLYEEGRVKSEAVDGLIAFARHPKEHYQKMIAVLRPLLSVLSDGEVGRLLSPDALDMTDKRSVHDTASILAGRCVFYAGLDALSNKTLARALGSMLLSDLSSTLGRLYSHGPDKKNDVFLLIDEASEVMNEQAIQILNKGRGAGMHVFVACQSVSDFEAVFKSRAKAAQVIANLNSVICLRVRDTELAAKMAETAGHVMMGKKTTTTGSNSASLSGPLVFTGSKSETTSLNETALVSPDLLMRLPVLEYFGFFPGGRTVKGKLPFLTDR